MYILYALHKAEEDFGSRTEASEEWDTDNRSDEEVKMMKTQLYTWIKCHKEPILH